MIGSAGVHEHERGQRGYNPFIFPKFNQLIAENMGIAKFIDQTPAERQATLTALHETIIANGPGVIPVIKPMIGSEMTLYDECCYMKYGVAGTKNIADMPENRKKMQK
jgi:hypothetical protein